MIKNIIFDAGGVIVKYEKDSHLDVLVKVFSVSLDEAKDIWKRGRERILVGEITVKDFINEVNNNRKSNRDISDLYNRWLKLYESTGYQLDKNVIYLIKRLKKNYKVYLLTNIYDTTGQHKTHLYVSKLFDKTFRSYELKMKKPDRKIFLHVLKETNAQPEETVFIDDQEKNIIAAKELGMKAILYENMKQLRHELKSLGISGVEERGG